MWRVSVLLVTIATACCGAGDGPGSPPEVPLSVLYTVPYPGGQTALLERPSEGRACLVASEGAPREVSPVRLVASGPASSGGDVRLESTDATVVPDAPLAELRVVDVDGDGNDEVLIRPRGLRGELLPPPGTPWRETLWVSDCSGVAQLVVDVSMPMTVPSLLVDSLHPISGGGSAIAIVTAMIGPSPFSYVVTRQLASLESPCTDMSCLPLLRETGSTISAPQPATWAVSEDELSIVHFDVHLVGHLESEWYAARRDCQATEGGYSCSEPTDWGPLTKALAIGFLDPGGDAYLRLSRPDLEFETGAAESWSTPADRVARALPGSRFEPAWARFAEPAWRFGGVLTTLDGSIVHRKPVVMEQSARETRVVSVGTIPGWSDERTGVLESNRARNRALILAVDGDRGAVALLPAE